MNWIYQGKEMSSVEDFPPLTFGFIYRIVHIPSGKTYIGKKVLQHTRKAKLTKKDLAIYEGQPLIVTGNVYYSINKTKG